MRINQVNLWHLFVSAAEKNHYKKRIPEKNINKYEWTASLIFKAVFYEFTSGNDEESLALTEK